MLGKSGFRQGLWRSFGATQNQKMHLSLRKLLGKYKLTFSVPFELYCEMEKNVSGSFFELDEWRELRDEK